MIPRTHVNILEAYARVARPRIKERFGVDSCIAATRITIQVAERFGLSAVPVSVVARAMNAEYMACEARFGRVPKNRREFDEWCEEYGAYVARVGDPDRSDGSGHLVAVVEGHTLVDASIDQIARPAHGLRLPPVLLAEARPGFRDGAPVLSGVGGGAIVQYQVAEEVDWYSRSEYWWSEWLGEVVEDVVDAMDVQPNGS